MDNYRDHLLTLDEMSAALASRAATKAGERAKRLGNVLPKIKDLASQPQNVNNPYAQKHVAHLDRLLNRSKRISKNLEQYAKNKSN